MKGFVSFTLVIAIIAVLLFFKIGMMETETKLDSATNELIKAEITNKDRTMLENGVDKIINKKLEEQILKNNFDTTRAQNEINIELSKYLYNKTYGAKITGENIGESTNTFLNENSKVTILKTKYLTYAEYNFCSNLLKNTTIKKKFGNEIKTEFMIPIGYTNKIAKPI